MPVIFGFPENLDTHICPKMFQNTLKRGCCKYRDSTVNGLYATMVNAMCGKIFLFCSSPIFSKSGYPIIRDTGSKNGSGFGDYFLILLPDFTLLHVPYKVSLPDFL